MKKLFDLQLFAEDDAAAEGAEPAPTAGGNEPAPTAKVEKQPELKYSDADVDKLINQKFAEWENKKQKEVGEAQKLATMNAQQKAEYERDQLQKELDEYKRKDSIAEMTKTARKMLSDSGITVPDELLSMMVTTDAEETKAAVDSFAKVFAESVESAVKERLKGESPRKGAGGGVAPMTKEAIMSIKDAELRQKKMLEHKELFNF